MGALFKSRTKTVQNPYEQNPWEPQQDYLTGGFEQGQAALDKALGTNTSMNPDQVAALKAMIAKGQGGIQGVSDAAIAAGAQGIGALSGFQSNAQDLYGMATRDATGDIVSGAGKFADNPYMQGQIDAALGDVRKAFDRDVAGINSASAGTGNINSTRAGALEARALDDAMDRGAAISSGMRGAAYDRGLAMSADEQARRVASGMVANQQIGSGAGMALDFANAGYGLGQRGNQDAFGAASGFQNEALRAQNQDLDLVSRYMQIVGGNYGGQGYTSQTTQQASPFQQILGGAATALGAWKSFA